MTHAYAEFLLTLAIRTAVIFLVMLAGLRLLGKRQIGQMNIYDLAMIMAIANAVQNAMTSGSGNLSVGIVSAGTLILLGRLLTALFIRSPRLEEHLVGTPTVIIDDGRLVPEHMRRERVTEEQVQAALRQHGLTKPEQVKIAVLEVDGTLSIVPREEQMG